MYDAFFSLKEKPFKLVPNPEFLFLGKSHEEALAHLTYATSQGDGFVEITGEVGTGKTTLCRVFLEDLEKDDIEVAFIFNSKLDADQLLKAILKELGIRSDASGAAELTAELNNYLLEKKSRGKSVILLIDEAQNLGSKTLEQLRLLSNLETTRSKLLQIILVGQPELRELLDSYEMRQLRQRINLSYHIRPMTRTETFNYIAHRINVASRKPQELFSHAALKAVYRFSRGIPRLINIVCDRSLLTAYSLGRKKVTPAMVKLAIDELNMNVQPVPRSGPAWGKVATGFIALMLVMGIFVAAMKYIPVNFVAAVSMADKPVPLPETPDKASPSADTLIDQSSIRETQAKEKFREQPVQENKQSDRLVPGVAATETLSNTATVQPGVNGSPQTGLPGTTADPLYSDRHSKTAVPVEKGDAKDVLSALAPAATRENAFACIASLWTGQPAGDLDSLAEQVDSDLHFFKLAAVQHGFQIMRIRAGTDQVKMFNLPAILSVLLPDDPRKKFLGVERITPEGEFILFPRLESKKYRVDPEQLKPFLDGYMYIAWKDYFGYDRVISPLASKDSILSIKLLLPDIGYPMKNMAPVYDRDVRQAIKQIQKNYGLAEDGLVGPLTKIALLSKKREKSTPYLQSNRRITEENIK